MKRRKELNDPMMRSHIRRVEEIDRMRADLMEEQQMLLWDLIHEAHDVREGVLDQMEKEMKDVGIIAKQHDV